MKTKYKIKILFLCISILIALSSVSPKIKRVKQIDNKGYVPDSISAIKIAEIIWIPIYGENVITEKPFKAKLVNDSIWVVEGTLKSGYKGGVAYIEIQKSDCKVLRVYHGK